MSDYLSHLNPSQLKAVEQTKGPVMVIAGAGSGKTRVLTYRIVHLLKQGVDAFNILSLTFTNKAAKEMKERIEKIVGLEAKNIWMGTFHSVFAKILRFEADKIGYPSNFTIYDSDDSKALLRRIIKEMNLDTDIYKVNIVQSRISSFKNNLITVKAYNNNAELKTQDDAAHRPQMGVLYEKYVKECFKSAAMDFDDLLLKTNELLFRHPDVLHKYQHRFHYVLVDEYQDTNHSQYLIVKALASLNENICVVGDDAQSIYSFRGANIRNILNFRKDYSDAKVIKLEQNYRSTQNIVNAANSVISNNKDQLDKKVWTSNPLGEAIKVNRATTDSEEAISVASNIQDTKFREQALSQDFAILYRTNAQSRTMEEALRKRNIPYRIYGGLSFYQRKEIKDMMAYFRMASNLRDEEALRRVINYPKRGIGNSSIDRMTLAAGEQEKSLWAIVANVKNDAVGLNSGSATKVDNFATLIKSFQLMVAEKDAFEVASYIAKQSGILREMQVDKTPEGISKFENLQELLNGIQDFVNQENEKPEEERNTSLSFYLEDIALLTDAEKADEDDGDHVSLMTIHQSKGLEFPYVYVVGLEENLFPSQMSLTARIDLEEERRLFYVALTRAEKRATLSYALTRYRWGNLIDCEPSRFIEEINEKYLDMNFLNVKSSPRSSGARNFGSNYKTKVPSRYNTSKKKEAPNQESAPRFVPKNLKKINPNVQARNYKEQSYSTGMKVEHERFGMGVISKLEGSGANKKISVNFTDVGEKTLLAKFAKLNILK
ncbi:MAG: UvrD-helicase domain-containing protein [Flavobacteriales bacterium]|jgi:DNA helicase-2/ATP-dependent DNA helicase PcrA|nr:UvrD-helicase domain-containing protein [Flavobacteriales bacterium]